MASLSSLTLPCAAQAILNAAVRGQRLAPRVDDFDLQRLAAGDGSIRVLSWRCVFCGQTSLPSGIASRARAVAPPRDPSSTSPAARGKPPYWPQRRETPANSLILRQSQLRRTGPPLGQWLHGAWPPSPAPASLSDCLRNSTALASRSLSLGETDSICRASSVSPSLAALNRFRSRYTVQAETPTTLTAKITNMPRSRKRIA